jgi:hypothetical protein
MFPFKIEMTKESQQTKGPCQQHGPFCLLISSFAGLEASGVPHE